MFWNLKSSVIGNGKPFSPSSEIIVEIITFAYIKINPAAKYVSVLLQICCTMRLQAGGLKYNIS